MKFGNKIPINAEHLWKLGNLTRKYYSTEKMNVTIKLLWKCFMVICHGLITLHNAGHKNCQLCTKPISLSTTEEFILTKHSMVYCQ
jgi:hypothetical protein